MKTLETAGYRFRPAVSSLLKCEHILVHNWTNPPFQHWRQWSWQVLLQPQTAVLSGVNVCKWMGKRKLSLHPSTLSLAWITFETVRAEFELGADWRSHLGITNEEASKGWVLGSVIRVSENVIQTICYGRKKTGKKGSTGHITIIEFSLSNDGE